MARFILTTPDGVSSFPFDPETLLNTDAMLLEEVTGRPIGDVYESFLNRGILGLNAMFWLARKHAGEEIAYADMRFNLAHLAFEQDAPIPPTPAAAKPPARKRAASKKK
ncbi:hypothetical protein NLX83_39510 [Allokutzneria sp. A3M-2-11 16]|uniref:hypothetical protein n=1 Tax=Allokutzneria sp. A3M-2-11 16 TaxID=2962043 RepID=UPI0020B8C1F7|nr:hypothetical protein [Allokutzneria sp. A3M-2-11 16]MCP3805372.1 hypothetical protein [Allokutzneria sp. A3M-2-11 16]